MRRGFNRIDGALLGAVALAIAFAAFAAPQATMIPIPTGGGSGSLAVQANGSPAGTATTLNLIPGNYITQSVSCAAGTCGYQPDVDTTKIATNAALQLGQLTALITTSSSSSVYTAVMSAGDPLTAYAANQVFPWNVGATACAGGAMTLNIDGLGATALKEADGLTNLTSAYCPANQILGIAYDATNTVFRVISGGPLGSGAVTGACALGTVSGTLTINDATCSGTATGTAPYAYFSGTVTGNLTIASPTLSNGYHQFEFTENATGGYSIAYNAVFTGVPVQLVAAAAVNVYSFNWTGAAGVPSISGNLSGIGAIALGSQPSGLPAANTTWVYGSSSGSPVQAVTANGNVWGYTQLSGGSSLGSLVVVQASTAEAAAPVFGAGTTACATAKATPWPLSGWFLNLGVSVNAATLGQTSVTENGCLNLTTVYPEYWWYVPVGSVSNAYVDTYPAGGIHVNAGQNVTFGVPGSPAEQASMRFVADSWSGLPNIIGSEVPGATTASSTQYIPPGARSEYVATGPAACIPLPAAATLSFLTVAYSTSPTANLQVIFYDNNAASGNTGVTVTIPAGAATPGIYQDATDTYAAAAGDCIAFETISGATTQAVINYVTAVVTFTGGNYQYIWGTYNDGTVTTQEYSAIDQAAVNAAFTSAAAPVPQGCTVSNLYVNQVTANGAAITTTATLQRAGTGGANAAVLTGTIGAGVSGVVAVDTTDTYTLVQADRIAAGFIATGGTSGQIGGWGAICQ